MLFRSLVLNASLSVSSCAIVVLATMASHAGDVSSRVAAGASATEQGSELAELLSQETGKMGEYELKVLRVEITSTPTERSILTRRNCTACCSLTSQRSIA